MRARRWFAGPAFGSGDRPGLAQRRNAVGRNAPVTQRTLGVRARSGRGPLDRGRGTAEAGRGCRVELPGDLLFGSTVHLHGGPAPVRRYLPELIQLILDRKIEPGKVFDKRLPLEEAAEAYRLMDQREAIKVLLEV